MANLLLVQFASSSLCEWTLSIEKSVNRLKLMKLSDKQWEVDENYGLESASETIKEHCEKT